MFHRLLLAIALVLGLSGTSVAQYALVEAFPNLKFRKPVMMTYSPDGTNRLFVVEQDGRIKVFPNEPNATQNDIETFLDISSKIPGGVGNFGEYGLLGLAFHPNYAENGVFFIDYVLTSGGQRTYLSKYQVSESDPNAADAQSETVIIEVDQILDNHNGGMMEFGNDGYLYLSLGDGGWQWPSGPPDPGNTSQDLTNLLGSMLRLDVDNPAEGLEYGIPADNPFVGNEDGYREEIFAYGFRNPWRFCIDHVTGKIWLGDVGFASWEEINIVESGKNYGWSQAEGFECRPGANCTIEAYEAPIHVYENGSSDGCSITGGRIYRGEVRPELIGKYIYGDWCAGLIWTLEDNGDGSYTNTPLIDNNVENIGLAGFGEDENHELYIMDLDFNEQTKIYRFEADPNVSVKSPKQTVRTFSLHPNYPNPFNPSTNIPYQLKSEMDFELVVYDMTGKFVRLLESGRKVSGEYTAVWDGRSETGEPVSSGVYAVRLQCGNKQILRKLTLLK